METSMEEDLRDQLLKMQSRIASLIETKAAGKPRQRASPKLSPDDARYRLRLEVPAGKTVVAVLEEALAAHGNRDVAAKAIGIHKDNLRFVQKMLIIKNQRIPEEARAKIDEAIASLEKHRSMTKVRDLAGPILDQYWQKVKDAPAKIKKQRRRLDATIVAIRESCDSTREMEIPRALTPQEARRAVAELAISIELIGRLMRQLLGEES